MSNSSIWTIDRPLSGSTTPGHSISGSNGNEGVLHILLSSKAGATPSDSFVFYLRHPLWVGSSPLQRCSPSRLGRMHLNPSFNRLKTLVLVADYAFLFNLQCKFFFISIFFFFFSFSSFFFLFSFIHYFLLFSFIFLSSFFFFISSFFYYYVFLSSFLST